MEILLISHDGAASGMKRAAKLIAGDAADAIHTIELTAEAGVEAFTQELKSDLVQRFSDGRMGVIFADLMGGTPFNRAEMLLSEYGWKDRIKVISGLNLSMVLTCLFEDITEWTQDMIQEITAAGKDGIGCMDLLSSEEDSEDE